MKSTKDKTLWRWWAKAIGEKASKCDRESDRIAIIRTVIFLTYLITNCFIVAGVVRHWNDKTNIEIFIEQPKGELTYGQVSTVKRVFEY